MADEFDFYATPNPKEDDGNQEYIDLPLTRAKSITRNRTLTFFILVFFSMGLCSWLLFSKDWKASWEKKQKRLAAEELLERGEKLEPKPPDTERTSIEEAPLAEKSLADKSSAEGIPEEGLAPQQLKLFPGTHKIYFRPDTGKEEGLSLFYVRGKQDIPASDVFDFEESRVRLEKSQEDLLIVSGESLETELDPVEMFMSVGRKRVDLGAPDQALEAFARVLALNPDHQEALALSSMLYSEGQQFSEAEGMLERLADLDPKNAEVRNNLAVVFLKQGREEDALTQLNMALDVEPDYLDAHINLGWVLLSKGEFRKVEHRLFPLYKIYPNHIGLLNLLVKALAAQGKGLVSRKHLERLIELDPSAEHFYTMARSYMLDGDSNRAMQWLLRGQHKHEDGTFRPYLDDAVFNELRKKPGAYRLFPTTPEA